MKRNFHLLGLVLARELAPGRIGIQQCEVVDEQGELRECERAQRRELFPLQFSFAHPNDERGDRESHVCERERDRVDELDEDRKRADPRDACPVGCAQEFEIEREGQAEQGRDEGKMWEERKPEKEVRVDQPEVNWRDWPWYPAGYQLQPAESRTKDGQQECNLSPACVIEDAFCQRVKGEQCQRAEEPACGFKQGRRVQLQETINLSQRDVKQACVCGGVRLAGKTELIRPITLHPGA